jgi:hypothetical protein
MTDSRDLFQGVHSTNCAFCHSIETHAPGWPLNGSFLTIRNGKLCLGCAKEIVAKLDALDLLSEIVARNRSQGP